MTNQLSPTKKNYDWIDNLRVLATFSVIVLHVAATTFVEIGTVLNSRWWMANIYDSATRFSVPIFLMISGALIFSKSYENISEYLKKRVSKIIIPFLFWSLLYIFKDLFFKYYYGELLTLEEIFTFTVKQLKNGASIHLWFVYMIIGLYLIFPIIGGWIRNTTANGIKYFLILWLFVMILNMTPLEDLIIKFNLRYFAGFIGYPVLGYFLSTNIVKYKLSYLLGAVAVGFLITLFGTFILTKQDGQFNLYFYHYLTPNILLVASGIFLIFKDFVKVGSKFRSTVQFFSKYSYGIFLVHILVLWSIEVLGFTGTVIHPIIGIPLISLICFLISTVIIIVVNKLPFGKYVSG